MVPLYALISFLSFLFWVSDLQKPLTTLGLADNFRLMPNRTIRRLSFSSEMLTKPLSCRLSSTSCSCTFRTIPRNRKGSSWSMGSPAKLMLLRYRRGNNPQNGYFPLVLWNGNPRYDVFMNLLDSKCHGPPQDGLYFLQLMKWGVLQYTVIRPTYV